MLRSAPAILALVIVSPAARPSLPRDRPDDLAVVSGGPDVRKARRPAFWPDEADLARLESVKGQPGWRVIAVLGHPKAVAVRRDGTEVWDYPWIASCRVWLRNGVCTATYYTGGW